MRIPLLAYEPFGRGADIENTSMEELFDLLSVYLPLIPITLALLFISWLVLRNRIPYEGENEISFFKSFCYKNISQRWFIIQEGDRWYTKVWIIILWIITIMTAIGGLLSLLLVILRILLGIISTFIGWLFLWLLSLGFILLLPAIPAAAIYYILKNRVKGLAITLAVVVYIGGIIIICLFWDEIIDWEWFFPDFPSIDINSF